VIVDEVAEDMGQAQQRQRILEWVARNQRPAGVALDRAVKADRGWCQAVLGVNPSWCETWKEQDVHVGLEILRSMFDPADGSTPTLGVAHYLAEQPGERGIHRCLKSYRYMQAADGRLLPNPLKDNVHDHGIDALRYWAVKLGLTGPAMIGVRRRGGHAPPMQLS
jgi:hypothetical protein